MARPVIEVSYAQVAFVLLVALAIALNSGTQHLASSIITGLATSQNPATSATITNAAPTAGNCYVPASLTLTADGNATGYCNCSVSDANGYSDIVAANATMSNNTIALTGASNQYTRQVNQTCTKVGGSGNNLWVNCTFQMTYYSVPGSWRCQMMVNDSSGNQLNITTNVTHAGGNMSVLGLVGMTIDPTSVAYGSIAAGSNGSGVLVNVSNVGNVQIDEKLEAGNLTNSSALGAGLPADFINVTNQWYCWNSSFTTPNTYQFTNVSTFNTSFNLAPTTTGAVVNQSAFFKLEVPTGKASGSYTGLILISAQEG